jgi:hypothetical protein
MTKAFLSIVLLLALSSQANAQRYYIFPNLVQIRGTATVALEVLGGIKTAKEVVTEITDAGTSNVTTAAIFSRNGASTTTVARGVGIAFRDANNQTWVAGIYAERTNSFANYNGDLVIKVAEGGAAVPSTTWSGAGGLTERLRVKSGGPVTITGGMSASGDVSALTVSAGTVGTGTSATLHATSSLLSPPYLELGYEPNDNGAAGRIKWTMKTGSIRYTWIDSAGDMRIHTAAPNNDVANDNGTFGGVAVGAQTSTWESKNILETVSNTAWALDEMLRTPVYRFTYKNGRYDGEEFIGITTKTSPLFGMDHAKAFNPLTSFGVTVLAIQELEKRIKALEQR